MCHLRSAGLARQTARYRARLRIPRADTHELAERGAWRTATQERSAPHRASIARTPKSTPVRRRVDNPLTSHFSPPQSTEIRRICIRNVEVGGSSPLTSTARNVVSAQVDADLV